MDSLQDAAAVRTQSLTTNLRQVLGFVDLREEPRDGVVPRKDGESIEIGHCRELGCLHPTTDQIPRAIGLQIGDSGSVKVDALVRQLLPKLSQLLWFV